MKKTREQIQSEALKALQDNNYTGVVCLSTGAGKTKVSIDAIKKGKFKNILITSPRTNLKENWRNELSKWGIVDASDVGEDNSFKIYLGDFIHIDIENIQTTYKWSREQILQYDLIIVDEIHFISHKYSQYLWIAKANNIPIIGLTATPTKSDEYKREVLYNHIPIVYEYYNSEKDGIINKVNYYVWEYELNNEYKILVGNETKQWFEGEQKQYSYMNSVFEDSARTIKDHYWNSIKANVAKEFKGNLVTSEADREFLEDIISKDLDYFYSKTKPRYDDRSYSIELYYALKRIKGYNYSVLGTNATKYLSSEDVPNVVKPYIIKYIWSLNERKNLLWNLNSSATKALALKQVILSANPDNKVLLFSELTKQADKLSPYYIHSNNGNTAKQIKEYNENLLNMFNLGEIRELSSCLSLTLGLNMSSVNWAIFESYSSSETNSKQRKGRLNRLNVNEFANVVILKPKNTQAETWFENAFGWIGDYKVIDSIKDLPLNV